MGENLGDDPGLFDGGDDLEVAATMGGLLGIRVIFYHFSVRMSCGEHV